MKRAEGSRGNLSIKFAAKLAETAARDSVDDACWIFVHQPKEPKNLAERVKELRSRLDKMQ